MNENETLLGVPAIGAEQPRPGSPPDGKWARSRGGALQDPIEEAIRLHNCAVECAGYGKLAEALGCARRSLEILEANGGPDTTDVANVLISLASICSQAGDHHQAGMHALRASEIMHALGERARSPDAARVCIQSFGLLGTVYRPVYLAAEPLLREALSLAEATFGPDDAETGAALNNLAVLYKYTAQFHDAERLCPPALAIAEEVHGPNHPETGRNGLRQRGRGTRPADQAG